jgi:hypothetical protein
MSGAKSDGGSRTEGPRTRCARVAEEVVQLMLGSAAHISSWLYLHP